MNFPLLVLTLLAGVTAAAILPNSGLAGHAGTPAAPYNLSSIGSPYPHPSNDYELSEGMICSSFTMFPGTFKDWVIELPPTWWVEWDFNPYEEGVDAPCDKWHQWIMDASPLGGLIWQECEPVTRGGDAPWLQIRFRSKAWVREGEVTLAILEHRDPKWSMIPKWKDLGCSCLYNAGKAYPWHTRDGQGIRKRG